MLSWTAEQCTGSKLLHLLSKGVLAAASVYLSLSSTLIEEKPWKFKTQGRSFSNEKSAEPLKRWCANPLLLLLLDTSNRQCTAVISLDDPLALLLSSLLASFQGLTMKPFASLQVATILGHPNLKCFAFALKVDFKRKTAAEERKKTQCMWCWKVVANSVTLNVFVYLVIRWHLRGCCILPLFVHECFS